MIAAAAHFRKLAAAARLRPMPTRSHHHAHHVHGHLGRGDARVRR
jgi:hypothetical protein